MAYCLSIISLTITPALPPFLPESHSFPQKKPLNFLIFWWFTNTQSVLQRKELNIKDRRLGISLSVITLQEFE